MGGGYSLKHHKWEGVQDFTAKMTKKGKKNAKRPKTRLFQKSFSKIIINVRAVTVGPGCASGLSLIFKNLFVTCGTIQILRNAEGRGGTRFCYEALRKIVGGRGYFLQCVYFKYYTFQKNNFIRKTSLKIMKN